MQINDSLHLLYCGGCYKNDKAQVFSSAPFKCTYCGYGECLVYEEYQSRMIALGIAHLIVKEEIKKL